MNGFRILQDADKFRSFASETLVALPAAANEMPTSKRDPSAGVDELIAPSAAANEMPISKCDPSAGVDEASAHLRLCKHSAYKKNWFELHILVPGGAPSQGSDTL